MTDWLKALRLRTCPFYCRFKGTPMHAIPQVDQRIAVDQARRFIYFRIPKAANSTVIRLLTSNDNQQYSSRAGKRSFSRPSKLLSTQVETLEQDFFLFTITRDPYSRILSAYLDKIVKGKRKRKANRALKKSAAAELSFEEFCRYLDQGGFRDDAHWYPQDWFIPCGTALMGHVGKMESLTDELDAITARIDPSRNLADTGSQRKHRTDANQKLKTYYTRDTARIIARVYQRDFERFDYPRQPDWLKGVE